MQYLAFQRAVGDSLVGHSAQVRRRVVGSAAIGQVRGRGGVVEVDAFQRLFGDLLGAVEDRFDGGGADQVRQAADHSLGPLMQIAVELTRLPI